MKSPAELLQDEIACYKKPVIEGRLTGSEAEIARRVEEAVRYLNNYRNEVAPKKRVYTPKHF